MPDLFKKEENEKEDKTEKRTFEQMKDGFKSFLNSNNKPGVPGWFSF